MPHTPWHGAASPHPEIQLRSQCSRPMLAPCKQAGGSCPSQPFQVLLSTCGEERLPLVTGSSSKCLFLLSLPKRN